MTKLGIHLSQTCATDGGEQDSRIRQSSPRVRNLSAPAFFINCLHQINEICRKQMYFPLPVLAQDSFPSSDLGFKGVLISLPISSGLKKFPLILPKGPYLLQSHLRLLWAAFT